MPSSNTTSRSLTRQSQLLREQHLAERHGGRTGLRLIEADRVRQRQPEHAEAIGHADAKMNSERGGRHEPAVEARFCDDVLARKKTGLLAGGIEFKGRAQLRSPKSSGFHPLLSLFTLLCSRPTINLAGHRHANGYCLAISLAGP